MNLQKILLALLCSFQAIHADTSRADAVILNAAIGDALGRVTEFIDTTDGVYQQFGPLGVTSLSQATMLHPTTQKVMVPYTDDTVMSLIVLETMLEGRANKSSTNDLMNALSHAFAQLFGPRKYIIDPLYAVRVHGLRNIKAGGELNELIKAGKNNAEGWWHERPRKDIPTEAGCGSVMRAWPIGLVFSDNIPFVITLADEQSKITHRHPMARAASVAMAVGIAHAFQGKTVDETVRAMIAAAEQFDAEELFYKTKAKKVPSEEHPTAQMIARDALVTSDMIRYAYEAARASTMPDKILGIHNKQLNYRSPQGFLLGWSADEAIAAAVYLFVRNSNDPQRAIIEGVNTPGDSDSIASLAGALVGAKSGITYTSLSSELLERRSHLLELAAQI